MIVYTTNECLSTYMEQGYINNIAIKCGMGEKSFEIFRSANGVISSKTLFDMASVTKIMVTTMLSLIAIDKGTLNINDSVSKFYHVPEDKSSMTIKNLLTHTMGMGYKLLIDSGHTYENIQDYILNIPSDVPIGTETMYSCPGYILLGKILEKLYGNKLDILFKEYIAKPLSMENSDFLPSRDNIFVNNNISDNDIGRVSDYNCGFLGGVSGNAGLFSCMDDVYKFVKMLLNHASPLISKKTFDLSVKNYTPKMKDSRALGFVYVDEKYEQTGNLFSNGAIGHCGHTGQSVFVDYKSGLYAIILSDATVSVEKKCGFDKYDVVKKMRQDIHNAIKKDLCGIL